MDKLFEKILNKDVWPTKLGLAISLVLGVVGIVAFDTFLGKFIAAVPIRGTCYILFLGATVLVWYWNRNRLPARSIDKDAGFQIILGIAAEDGEARTRLENDFVAEFNRQLQDSDVEDLFHLQPLDPFASDRLRTCIKEREKRHLPGRKIDKSVEKEWLDLHTALEGDLYIWGTIAKRQGDSYLLRIHPYVDEEQLHPQVRKDLRNDYLAFGMDKRLIPVADEVKGFELEARFNYLFAKYVVAFVALYNLRTPVSHRLHMGLLADFEKANELKEQEYFLSRVRTFLSIEHVLFAREKFFAKDVPGSEAELEKARQYDATNTNIYMLWAVIEFLARRRVDAALNYIYQVRSLAEPNQIAWRYSEAFLRMYRAEYKEALSIYEYIFAHPFADEAIILNQVISFNLAIAEHIEPKFIESRFILGLVRYRKIGDLPTALDDFNLFIDRGRARKYSFLRREAVRYRDEIRAVLETA